MTAQVCISFTEHVRTFGRDCDPAACVLPRLEQLLRQRMRRRNLISAPPAYLGYDLPSWGTEGAFEDVVVDCYVFAVAKRIEGLRNQLRTRVNIDGLITRNVDNFLTERQSRRDPVGYAIFGNVEGAAEGLAAMGQLTVEGVQDGRLRGESLLRLDQAGSVEPIASLYLQAAVADAAGWGEALASLTSTTDEGQTWVADFLQRLRAAGFGCIRVSDLVFAIGSRARADWAARHADRVRELGHEGEHEDYTLVRVVWPDESVEIQDQLTMLKRVVPELIGQEQQQRVRNGLTVVFEAWIRMIEDGGLSSPKQVDLAEQLSMSEKTLSDYLKRLRILIGTILQQMPEG